MASWAIGVDISTGVRVMRHESQFPAGGRYTFEQAKHIVSVRIGNKSLGPECGGFSANADIPNVLEFRIQQRLDVAGQSRCAHYHGIAPRL